MIVSHRHRFVFLHANRTGGTSVAAALLPHADEVYGYAGLPGLRPELVREQDPNGLHKHVTLGDLARAGLLARFDGYRLFCFARNPWDRMLSTWLWWVQLARPRPGWPLSEVAQRVRAMGFAEYLASDAGLARERPAAEFAFCDERSADFVGRFESLELDFAELCRKLGLPATALPRLHGTRRGEYRPHYDAASSRAVARHFTRDVEAFGYRFD